MKQLATPPVAYQGAMQVVATVTLLVMVLETAAVTLQIPVLKAVRKKNLYVFDLLQLTFSFSMYH